MLSRRSGVDCRSQLSIERNLQRSSGFFLGEMQDAIANMLTAKTDCIGNSRGGVEQ